MVSGTRPLVLQEGRPRRVVAGLEEWPRSASFSVTPRTVTDLNPVAPGPWAWPIGILISEVAILTVRRVLLDRLRCRHAHHRSLVFRFY